jgi:hypothetical protein
VLADVGRAGRDFVWRDDDEEKLFPKDYERALVLAAKRGIREYHCPRKLRKHELTLRIVHSRFQRTIRYQCTAVAFPVSPEETLETGAAPSCDVWR